jgi:hypothetical protein
MLGLKLTAKDSVVVLRVSCTFALMSLFHFDIDITLEVARVQLVICCAAMQASYQLP